MDPNDWLARSLLSTGTYFKRFSQNITQERKKHTLTESRIDWCCFYHFVRNSLVALLEALCARRTQNQECFKEELMVQELLHWRFLVWYFKRFAFWPGRVFPRSRGKGPLTYGRIGGEKWSRTPIHQEFMVPCMVRNGHNTFQISTPIHRFINPVDRSQSISTVDADSPTENYGRSLIVD